MIQPIRRLLRWLDTMTLRAAAIFAPAVALLLAVGAYAYDLNRASFARALFDRNVDRIVAAVAALDRSRAQDRRLIEAINSATLHVAIFEKKKPGFLKAARCYSLYKRHQCEIQEKKGRVDAETEAKEFGIGALARALWARNLVNVRDVTAIYFLDIENAPRDDDYRTGFSGSERFDPLPSRRKAIVGLEYGSGDDSNYAAFVIATDSMSPGWAWRVAGWLLAVAGGGVLLAGLATHLAAGALRRLSLADPATEAGPREARRIAGELKQSQERLRFVEQDLSWALASLTHDMRTALVRLGLLIENLGDGPRRHRAQVELAQMQTMLHEAYTVARDTSNEEPQQVDLGSLAQSLCDAANDAGRTAHYRGPRRLVLTCQPSAIRRALANLVDNAIEYGGEADVEISQDDQTVRIAIGDRGPGIPEADREAAFAAYRRLEDRGEPETEGRGLGLAIARNAIRRCGGDIALRDREGGGLEVLVTLPKS